MKTVLITGAAKRLGAYLARGLAADGWQVIIHCFRSREEADALAKEIKGFVVQGDLSELGCAPRLFEEAQVACGTVTALINNAAIFKRDSLADISQERLDAHMHTNLLAPLWMIDAFSRQLEGQKGQVIHILDGGEGQAISSKFLSYALSKKALESTISMLARELAPRIRLNAVAPALVLPQTGEEAMFARLQQRTPLEVNTSAEEVLNSARFLLASDSMTGQVLRLDSGASL